MGVRAAYVVYGAGGTDELSIAGANRVSHYQGGQVRTFDFDPAELGIGAATVHDLLGGSAEENAAITRGILCGDIQGPKRDAVLLNTAFALSTESGDLTAGLAAARQSIDSGAALRVLDAFVRKTQSFVQTSS
jgi:anthranilate phosphoribosyltransferase